MTTATPQLPDNLLRARPEEGDALEALRQQIDGIFREHRTARLVGPDGEAMEIPASAFHALKLVVQGMTRGQTMTLVPHGKELTTQKAADLLRIEDVLAYREARAGHRREQLDELTRRSEELEGGYR